MPGGLSRFSIGRDSDSSLEDHKPSSGGTAMQGGTDRLKSTLHLQRMFASMHVNQQGSQTSSDDLIVSKDSAAMRLLARFLPNAVQRTQSDRRSANRSQQEATAPVGCSEPSSASQCKLSEDRSLGDSLDIEKCSSINTFVKLPITSAERDCLPPVPLESHYGASSSCYQTPSDVMGVNGPDMYLSQGTRILANSLVNQTVADNFSSRAGSQYQNPTWTIGGLQGELQVDPCLLPGAPQTTRFPPILFGSERMANALCSHGADSHGSFQPSADTKHTNIGQVVSEQSGHEKDLELETCAAAGNVLSSTTCTSLHGCPMENLNLMEGNKSPSEVHFGPRPCASPERQLCSLQADLSGQELWEDAPASQEREIGSKSYNSDSLVRFLATCTALFVFATMFTTASRCCDLDEKVLHCSRSHRGYCSSWNEFDILPEVVGLLLYPTSTDQAGHTRIWRVPELLLVCAISDSLA
jgi:hypothetical protein